MGPAGSVLICHTWGVRACVARYSYPGRFAEFLRLLAMLRDEARVEPHEDYASVHWCGALPTVQFNPTRSPTRGLLDSTTECQTQPAAGSSPHVLGYRTKP